MQVLVCFLLTRRAIKLKIPLEYRIALADTAYISHKLGTKVLVTNDAKNFVQIIFLLIYDIFAAFCFKNIAI